MPDREKVIEALEHCTRKAEPSCAGCPYFSECAKELLAVERDALELLRGQEAVKPEIRTAKRSFFLEGDCEVSIAYCGCCGFEMDQPTESGEGWKYCPCCGRRVKWDEVD